GGQGVDDTDIMTGGAAIVRIVLNGGTAVYVRHDHPIPMLRAPGAHIFGPNRGGERAAGLEVGDEHQLVGVRDRGGLGHEVHAADDDHWRVELDRPARHSERVGDDVGHVLDGRDLVVVREDGGAA